MNQPIEIAEVNRRAFIEKWPPGRASRLIADIRAKYDLLYLNQQTDGNKKGTQEAPIDKGMEGG
jgi:hypothetical protein